MSHLEDIIIAQIRLAKLPEPEREISIIPHRKFKFDLVWRSHRLAVEVQGGTWNAGAHGRGAGISRDTEKANLAVLEGWKVLCFTSDQIRQWKALRWLQTFFGNENASTLK